MSPRVAVIGPRRRRTGTGPFVSAFLREAGCAVQDWDRGEAGRLLEPGSTLPALDAVAICSPPETHLDYLAAAISRGLHVLCEKPIVWPQDDEPGRLAGLIERLSGVLDRAREKRLVVHENTQWAYTLPDFRRIAGNPELEHLSHFRCELSPSTGTAAAMLMECSAHANSLLLALGCQGVENLSAAYSPGCGQQSALVELRFVSRNIHGGPVQSEYYFAQQAVQPRHAAYEVNHRRVERLVDPIGYQISFLCDGQTQAIRDPFQSSVEDFLSRIAGGSRTGDMNSRILSNISMSHLLLTSLAAKPEAARA